MGSVEFASMIAALLAMSQGITLMLSKSLLLFFDYDRAFYSEYAVGFSGVLFAMKVVLNSQSDSYTQVHGLIVPARHAAWAELILVQLLVPGVSFLGHLGGILAGILYLRLKGSFSGSDPLALVIRRFTRILTWPVRIVQGFFRSRQRRLSGRGTVGGSQRGRFEAGTWRCGECTYDNSAWLTVCEMCGSSQSGNRLFSRQFSHHSLDLPLEELRRRRIERFNR